MPVLSNYDSASCNSINPVCLFTTNRSNIMVTVSLRITMHFSSILHFYNDEAIVVYVLLHLC